MLGFGVVEAGAQPAPRPSIRAIRLDAAPLLDGDVLGDPVWQRMDSVTGFVQVEPDDRQPATEKTEVRIGFDSQALYIGVVLYDSEPETLTVSDSRRDANLDGEDSFRVIFDTFHDRNNGFVFGTNLAGIQHDGQVTDEGRSGGGGRRRSGGGGFNREWNTSWEVATSRGDWGWSAEMVIPFRSLRYGSGEGTWGVNFERNIRRKNERAFWAPLDRQFNLFRVSEAGTLAGLEAPKQRNLQLLPYVLAETSKAYEVSREENFDLGIDIKYGLTPSLTLDATINTDFAQVEVDEQQINLDRFSLFFPEKRPFFLENAGFFTVGNSGSADLFFSRRIGLEGGEVIPILAGARVSGRAKGFNLGFLNMQTDDHTLGDGTRLSADNFTVARVSREYPNRSRIGGLFTNRVGTGPFADDDEENQVFAVDGQLGIGQYAEVSGWASKSKTPGLEGDEHAFSLRGSYSSPEWRWRANYTEVGDDFNPGIGFLSRRDYRNVGGFVMRRFRLANSRIKEIGPRLFTDSFWRFDGFHETGMYSLGGEIEMRSGFRVSLSGGGRREGLQEPFEIFPGVVIPAGTYDTNGYFIFLNTGRGKRVSLFARIQGGGFFDGDQLAFSPSVNVRFGESLSSQLSWQHNDIDLQGGSFETNLGRWRVTYAFSTSLILQALVQYNDVSDDVSTNLRFSWLAQANTGLFVVYTEVREVGGLALPQPDRSLIVKYSRLFDVFK
jgi:hypothetical protein